MITPSSSRVDGPARGLMVGKGCSLLVRLIGLGKKHLRGPVWFDSLSGGSLRVTARKLMRRSLTSKQLPAGHFRDE
jgi:hypothetical protein